MCSKLPPRSLLVIDPQCTLQQHTSYSNSSLSLGRQSVNRMLPADLSTLTSYRLCYVEALACVLLSPFILRLTCIGSLCEQCMQCMPSASIDGRCKGLDSYPHTLNCKQRCRMCSLRRQRGHMAAARACMWVASQMRSQRRTLWSTSTSGAKSWTATSQVVKTSAAVPSSHLHSRHLA